MLEERARACLHPVLQVCDRDLVGYVEAEELDLQTGQAPEVVQRVVEVYRFAGLRVRLGTASADPDMER